MLVGKLLARAASGIPDSPDVVPLGSKDIGWQALGPGIGCTLLATAFVVARWYARCRLSQCLGADDWVITISLVFSWAMTALIGAEVNGGVGVFAGPVDPSTVAKLVIASNILWILIVNVTKASILFQYLRIFSGCRTRLCCYFLLLLLLPAACWAIFGGIFLCSPTAKLWKPQLPGHCMSAQQYWLSVAGNDISLDFLVLLLPMPAITNLRLPHKQKLGLVLVFTLGFFVCVVSLIRLLTVLISSNQGHFVASGIWAIVWSTVEANVGIICASLLSLKPLLTKLFPKLMDEIEPPKHSIQIGTIGEDSCYQTGKVSTHARPSTATTLGSKKSSIFKRFSATGFTSLPPLSAVECLHVIESEYPRRTSRQQARERLSLFDVLQEDEEEARARVGRRSSCFTEHV